jgi:5-methylcytosine-specific restriction enzyme A
MTPLRRPCLDCGVPTDAARCPTHTTDANVRRGSAAARGYDHRWRRLSRRAIRKQPWCTDCGTRDDLTGDHLRWPARTLADVDVVCRGCNSRRGAVRTTEPHPTLTDSPGPNP